MNLDHSIEFPTSSDIVYVIGVELRGKFVPFYVGESTRNVGRIGDYVSKQPSAPTDFKVGNVVSHLISRGYRVVVKYGESEQRRTDEKQLKNEYRAAGFILLNGKQKIRIDQFVSNLVGIAQSKG